MVGVVMRPGSGVRLCLVAALAAAAIRVAHAAAPMPLATPPPLPPPTTAQVSTPTTPLPVPLPRAGDAFPDPMRPPGGVPAPTAAATGRAAAVARAEGGGAPRLQSVLLGDAGARAAVINGTLLAVGDRLGDARLLRLTERSAVLVGPHGQTTTLLLTPGVDKRDAETLPHEAVPALARAPGRRPAIPYARRATETTP